MLEEGIASSLGVETLQSLGYKVSKATGSIAPLHLHAKADRSPVDSGIDLSASVFFTSVILSADVSKRLMRPRANRDLSYTFRVSGRRSSASSCQYSQPRPRSLSDVEV